MQHQPTRCKDGDDDIRDHNEDDDADVIKFGCNAADSEKNCDGENYRNSFNLKVMILKSLNSKVIVCQYEPVMEGRIICTSRENTYLSI